MLNENEKQKYVIVFSKYDFELIKRNFCGLTSVPADNIPKAYITSFYNSKIPSPQVKQFHDQLFTIKLLGLLLISAHSSSLSLGLCCTILHFLSHNLI